MLDDGRGEAWILVVDGGGQVTDEFDESVFDDDVIPQPGHSAPSTRAAL